MFNQTQFKRSTGMILILCALFILVGCNGAQKIVSNDNKYDKLIEKTCTKFGYNYTKAMAFPLSNVGHSYKLTNTSDHVEITVTIENGKCDICVENDIISVDEKIESIEKHIDTVIYIGSYFSNSHSQEDIMDFLHDETICSELNPKQYYLYYKENSAYIYAIESVDVHYEEYEKGDCLEEYLIISF